MKGKASDSVTRTWRSLIGSDLGAELTEHTLSLSALPLMAPPHHGRPAPLSLRPLGRLGRLGRHSIPGKSVQKSFESQSGGKGGMWPGGGIGGMPGNGGGIGGCIPGLNFTEWNDSPGRGGTGKNGGPPGPGKDY